MYTEDELYNMSDDELEAAFKEAKADIASPDVEIDEVDQDIGTSDDNNDVSDLEQSDDSSDSDHDSDDELDLDVADDEPATAEEDLDGDLDADADNSKDVSEDDSKDSQPSQQMYKFKANGREFEFTRDEIEAQFPKVFGQAMDYTKKMQSIKPWRKTIDALESAKLGHDDINLMIDVMKGDKSAIAEVLKRTGVDTLDLDMEDSKYVANDYGRDDKTLQLKEVIDTISVDKEFEVTRNVLEKQWDDSSFNVVGRDPVLVQALHEDVKSGLFDIFQTRAEKLKVFDGAKKSDLDYYGMAAAEYYQEEDRKAYAKTLADQKSALAQKQQNEAARIAQVKAKEEARKATQKASAKRKDAAPTKGRSKGGAIDYLDTSDEAFEEWYKKTMENR